MSFSIEIKEELSQINHFHKMKNLKAELMGFLCTANAKFFMYHIEIITENEFCIERLYKVLFKLKIDYIPDMNGKTYIAKIQYQKLNKVLLENAEVVEQYDNRKQQNEWTKQIAKLQPEFQRDFIRGVFLGSGSVNEPEKNYHLELLFANEAYLNLVTIICKKFGIDFKYIQNQKGIYVAYLKEGEAISNFLALIGSNKGVLKFEEVRVLKEMKNDINRKVNCETANLNKTIDAAILQIEDIMYLKEIKKFAELTDELKEVAYLRLKNPETSLKELGQMLSSPIGKSGVNHRLKKIQALAEEYRKIRRKEYSD